MKTGQEILKEWLVGTTCHRDVVKRSVLLENDTHVVLKHNAHAEYCGRSSGVSCCQSYAKLYAKAIFDENFPDYRRSMFYGDNELLMWEGRINKTKVLADCQQQLGVIFE